MKEFWGVVEGFIGKGFECGCKANFLFLWSLRLAILVE